ncbi:MAG: GNAT family N-acetyltransferase [Chloroflexi bacterium]|nr:GNAT family N-acetyltransferase [Chloroflexota bacterium]
MEVVMRQPVAADLGAILVIRGGAPSDEQIGLAGGDAGRAVRFRDGLLRISYDAPTIAQTTLALRDGEPVGLLQAGREMDDAISMRIIVLTLRVYGPVGALRMLSREKARQRVSFGAPEDAYHIAELHVAEAWRGHGIGAAMLEHGERAARDSGYRKMSLTTTLSNPARRLYERAGFRVVETRTDAEYERITGIPGRVLMIKELA